MPQGGFGSFDSSTVYDVRDIATRLGFKQARTVLNKLRDRGIYPDDWGHGCQLVPGSLLLMAVEKACMERAAAMAKAV